MLPVSAERRGLRCWASRAGPGPAWPPPWTVDAGGSSRTRRELLQAAASTASGTRAAAVPAKRIRLVTGEYSFTCACLRMRYTTRTRLRAMGSALSRGSRARPGGVASSRPGGLVSRSGRSRSGRSPPPPGCRTAAWSRRARPCGRCSGRSSGPNRFACARLCVTIMTVSAGVRLLDQFLDRLGGHRVERRGRLVKQQHIRTDRQRPGQAEQLLLSAGQPERRVLEPVAHRVPQADLGQPLLGDLLQARACWPAGAPSRRPPRCP